MQRVKIIRLRAKRKVIRVGDSRGITIPAGLECVEPGETVTLAAGPLLLIDPTGRITEDELGRLLEDLVEPALRDSQREGAVTVPPGDRARKRREEGT